MATETGKLLSGLAGGGKWFLSLSLDLPLYADDQMPRIKVTLSMARRKKVERPDRHGRCVPQGTLYGPDANV